MNQKESKTTIDSFFSEIGKLYDDICKTQFKRHMTSTSSVDFVNLFDKYVEFLRYENGKLSKFWLAYLDMVEIRSTKTSESIVGRQLGTICFSNKEHDSMVLCISELWKIFILPSIRNVSPWRGDSGCFSVFDVRWLLSTD